MRHFPGNHVAAGFEGSRSASSHDSAEQTSLFSHSLLSNLVVDIPCDGSATLLRKLQREIHGDSFLLGSRRPKNRGLGIRFWKPLGAIHSVLASCSLYPSGTAMDLLFTAFLFPVNSLPLLTGRLVWKLVQPAVGPVLMSPRGGGPTV